MTFPVRYLVAEGKLWPYYNILDTSFEGQGKIVAKVEDLETAHRIAKFLNEAEGYVYVP